jgi:fatty acid/phospholipid biosynthesis enzyme
LQSSGLNFIGNLEGKDLRGQADVWGADGSLETSAEIQ